MFENEISQAVIGAAIKVHRALGPGLLESAYKYCLHYELKKSRWPVEIEKAIPLVYEEVKLECGYRADLVVCNKLLIEVKSIEALNNIHFAQTLTYLKLADFKLGLLLNFNVLRLKDGIKRISNGYLTEL